MPQWQWNKVTVTKTDTERSLLCNILKILHRKSHCHHNWYLEVIIMQFLKDRALSMSKKKPTLRLLSRQTPYCPSTLPNQNSITVNYFPHVFKNHTWSQFNRIRPHRAMPLSVPHTICISDTTLTWKLGQSHQNCIVRQSWIYVYHHAKPEGYHNCSVTQNLNVTILEMNPQMDNLRGVLDDYYTDPNFVYVTEQTKQKWNKNWTLPRQWNSVPNKNKPT